MLKNIKKIVFGAAGFFLLAVQISNPNKNTFIEIPAFGQFEANSIGAVLAFFITKILLPLVGIVSVLFIIIGGYQYMTAGINEEQAEQGKKTLQNAVIGLSIIILSYIIVNVVINALSGNVGA